MQELIINLNVSKQFVTLILITILSSLAIVVYLSLPIWIKLLLAISILTYGSQIVWKHGLLKHPKSITQIIIDQSEYFLADHHQVYLVTISGDSTITTTLCVLRFLLPNQRLKSSCIIFKDMMQADDYRRLLVLLKNNR